jgi:UDP-N-acetylmuramate dehydrogenase
MQIRENVSLKPFNTFGIDAMARYFLPITNHQSLITLQSLITNHQSLILGGGSNLLFTRDFDGLVIHNQLKGMEVVRTTAEHVWVKVAAGEVWHAFVEYCLEHDFAGVENLALIPGYVGASPMQNIGAYGVEVKEVIEEVEAWHLREGYSRTFSNEECGFGYRESVFKRELKGIFLITSVTFRLNKVPLYHLEYGAIRQELERMGVVEPTIRSVADAVIRIRQSKLPDPRKIGNAGSFFKNPEVPSAQYESLKALYPELPGYPQASGRVKLAAGWLIEKAGWKGVHRGEAGVHDKQALVLVNLGNATGKEIWQLSEEILRSVQQQFGVLLEREVNIV